MSRPTETPEERAERLQEFANRGGTISAEEYKKRSRRAFLGFVPGAIGAFAGFKYLQGRPEQALTGAGRPATDNIPGPLREVLEFNEAVWDTVGRDGATARSYPISDAEPLRVNGRHGLRDGARSGQVVDIDLDAWRLDVVGVDGNLLESVSIDPIRELETYDHGWEHKCIEGWSNIVHWTGARFSDFAARYADDVPQDFRYVSMRTPDDLYYIGLDRSSVMHDQMLLAWGLNGEPLTQAHGAPLRLATPNFYGIKQIKRIGTIEFTNERPADYWADRGYDWYAGF